VLYSVAAGDPLIGWHYIRTEICRQYAPNDRTNCRATGAPDAVAVVCRLYAEQSDEYSNIPILVHH